MTVLHPFHLAFPVTSIDKARAFYGGLLGCPEGRSAEDWVDFDLYGHQIVAHLAPDEAGHRATSAVDGDAVPVRHFGVVLSMPEWQTLAERLKAAGTRLRDRAARAIHGSGRRAGDDVLPRPMRQCARVQGLCRPFPAVCEVSAP